ncbi:SRPBCC domain-containing protein [Burkholderia sp. Ac-20353]|uniref:SRPBCC domain-containing protein n=1 Tax=Burkholderia sp. Ac-20353 TaxID=2703894 RepID=UPI00197C2EFA|nr:SRPBCC domain-containing protein [Burkholderia sp. Ac-20353]MBN3786597.1 SRPBCC domain-containing protein [Burkholderia sp. Ac-20353]
MTMRTRILTGIAIFVVGVIGVLVACHGSGSAQAELVVGRPPAEVWKVVANGAAYADWNPFITRVDGEFKEGATVRIVIGTEPNAMVFAPKVLRVRVGRDLCWRGSVWIRGIFDGEHCIHLSSVNGSTLVEQSERFTGLLAGRLTEGIVRDTRQQFQAMNAALKKRVESDHNT